jgi:hypothetical protein
MRPRPSGWGMTSPDGAGSGPLRRVELWRVVEALRENRRQLPETGRQQKLSRSLTAVIAAQQRRDSGRGPGDHHLNERGDREAAPPAE